MRSTSTQASNPLGTVLVGGGPAGTALLVAAARQGRLAELADAGLAIVERGNALGGGRLGNYAITSDSTAETFLTAVKDIPGLAQLINHPAAQGVADHIGDLGVPLAKAGVFLDALGGALQEAVEQAGGAVFARYEAVSAQRTSSGAWKTRLRRITDGAEHELLSHNLVLATGGHQPRWRIEGERVAGVSLTDRFEHKMVQSGDVLEHGGVDMLRARLAGYDEPTIVIVGGSTSALTIANKLLKDAPNIVSRPGAITIAHRRPLRPYYPSAEAAITDGYDDFGPDDICPVSGFVYRLAGFRLEARDLVLRSLEIGGRQRDPRLDLHRIGTDDAATLALLDGASVIIAALGYRPIALPLFNARGLPIRTPAAELRYTPLVDGRCRVVDVTGRPVPDLFALGLAAGFVPHGELGGEPSFSGQANGLWVWQNGVGDRILDQLLDLDERDTARRTRVA